MAVEYYDTPALRKDKKITQKQKKKGKKIRKEMDVRIMGETGERRGIGRNRGGGNRREREIANILGH